MSTNAKTDIFLKSVLFSGLFFIIIIPFLNLEALFLALALIIFYIILIGIFYPFVGVCLFVAARPCLDIFSDKTFFYAGSIPINFASIFGILSIFFALYALVSRFPEIKNIPLKIPWIIFLAVSFASIFFSSNTTMSLSEWLRLTTFFALYILAFLTVNTNIKLRQFMKVIIFSTLIPCGLAVYQFITKTGISLPMEGIYNRIYGTFAHSNPFAYYLLIPIVILIFFLLVMSKKKVSYFVYCLLLVFYIIILALTYTRGAWAAFVIILLSIGIFKSRIFLAFATVGLLASYFLIAPIKSRINDLFNLTEYSSITWRFNLWKDSIGYMKNSLFFGYGGGTAKFQILRQRGDMYGSTEPHNDYIKIMMEYGVIGLCAYFYLIGSLFYGLIKGYLNMANAKKKLFLLMIISLSGAFFIMSFADNFLRSTALEWAYWAIIGATFATLQIYPKKLGNGN